MFYYYTYKRLRGSIDFESLMKSIEDRIQGVESSNQEEDYLCHLILCVLVREHPQFRSTVLKIEERIFDQRLKSSSKDTLTLHIQQLIALLQEVKIDTPEYTQSRLDTIRTICKTLEDRIYHAFSENHDPNCSKKVLKLAFTFPLRMVSNRRVELELGKAVIPCNQWKELLGEIFCNVFHLEIDAVAKCKILHKLFFQSEDDRFRQILFKLTRRLGGNPNVQIDRNLTADCIDHESQYFPPCMANLHQILRKTHRLSFDSRCDYTLFLKDIGLSVEENTTFWRSEYVKPHQGAECTHHWQDKANRYEYQIKHMYGLVGESGATPSRPCHAFINKLTFKSNGGCPFKHFSEFQLKNALPRSVLSSWSQINEFRENDQPTQCCAVYLSRLYRRNFNFEVMSPLQFYFAAKKYEV